MDAADRAAIEARLRDYDAAWRSNRAEALRAHWDAGDPAPFYLAEERDAPMLGWPDILDYWRGNEGLYEEISLGLVAVAVKPVGADAALLLATMDWRLRLRRDGSRLGGDNRVMAGLRRVGEDWLFHAWVEAPLAPLTYMRRLYERRGVDVIAKARSAP